MKKLISMDYNCVYLYDTETEEVTRDTTFAEVSINRIYVAKEDGSYNFNGEKLEYKAGDVILNLYNYKSEDENGTIFITNNILLKDAIEEISKVKPVEEKVENETI